MTIEVRRDFHTLKSVKKTRQGFIRVQANLTRTGVLEYRRQDGTVRREYRPPEEVFSEASMATLRDACVVDLHPNTFVTSHNVSMLSRGHVSSMRKDTKMKFIEGELFVTDQDMIDMMESGERRDLSPGYTVRLDMTPGVTPDGETYDAVQRDIHYDHIGVGPKGWGRSGPEVSLRMDGDTDLAVQCREDTILSAAPSDDTKGEKTMTLTKIRIDGVEHEVPEAAAPYIVREIEKLDTKIQELTDTASAAEARADGFAEDLKKAKDEAQAREDGFDAAVQARYDLIENAHKISQKPETKFDGKSDHEIRLQVITERYDGKDFSEKSELYVQTRFDHLVDTFEEGPHPKLAAAAAGTESTEKRKDAGPARPRNMTEMWQEPLSASRTQN